MADNRDMKTNTIVMLLTLITLVSCNGKDSGGSTTYKAPVGTLNKQWLTGSSLSGKVTSVDLSNPNNIIVTDATHVQVLQKPSNGMPGRYIRTVSDCVYSSPGQVATTDLNGYFEVTLVSGDPIACNQFMPKMYYMHYGFEENSEEFLQIAGGLFK